MNKKKNWIVIGLVLVVFFIFNRIIPFYGDDIMFARFDGRHIENIGEVIDKALALGGLARVWCVFLNSLFAGLLGNLAFDIANTIAMGVVLWAISRFILPKETDNIWIGWATMLICLFSLTTAKDTLFYWGAGGCFYIIPMVLVIAFLGWFASTYRKCGENKYGVGMLTLIVIGSVLLNLHHEMYVCIMLGTFVYYVATNYKTDERLKNPALWAFFIGACLAFAYLVFAGNTLERSGKQGFSVTGIASKIVKALVDVRIGALMVAILIVHALKAKERAKEFIKQNQLWLVAAACALAPSVIAGQGGRALFAMELISAVVIVKWIYFTGIDKMRYAKMVGLALLASFFVVEGLMAYDYHKKWNIFETAMQQYINQDDNVVTADDYKGIESIYTLDLDQTFTDHWFVYGYELQKKEKVGHEVDKVVVVTKTIEDAVKSGQLFTEQNKVDGNGEFYHIPNTYYYVRKYDKTLADAIKEGRLAVDNTCAIGGGTAYRVRLVHVKKQLDKRNVVNIADRGNGEGYIFIYNKETSIPLTDVTNISITERGKEEKWMQLSF